MKKVENFKPHEAFPYFKSPQDMAKLCGIGENTLRTLMDRGELEFLPIGNRRLLYIEAVLDYYQRHKVSVQKTS